MESLVGTYRILQPGSSVACSLSMTESSLFPKHMAFFEVKEKKFRMKPIKYQQNRYFIYNELCLKDNLSLNPNSPKVDDQIRDIVITKINEMIVTGRNAVENNNDNDNNDHNNSSNDNYKMTTRFKIKDPQKILIRLKVDYFGFNSFNVQRFTSQFVNEVANANSIILLAKKKKEFVKTVENRNNNDYKQLLGEEGIYRELNS